jgi:hypothetical protein
MIELPQYIMINMLSYNKYKLALTYVPHAALIICNHCFNPITIEYYILKISHTGLIIKYQHNNPRGSDLPPILHKHICDCGYHHNPIL